MSFGFTLNGERVEVTDTDPHITLLWYLRNRGLTGTKEGCAEGECGACAVAIVRRGPDGSTRYEPVNSCLVLLPSIADHEVVTVEGIAKDGALHPVQEAMAKAGGSQCGYCTPGFVVSLFSEYYRPDRNGYDPEAISGNLCRCTGYRPIREAAQSLGRPSTDDPHRHRLALAPPELSSLRYETGDRIFLRPRTLAEAQRALAEHPDAAIIAGGTDLVVESNQRYRRWQSFVSLENIAELCELEWRDDCLRIGGAVTLAEIEHHVQGKLPMLEELFPLFASRLIRNRATLGGNLATASPIGDGPPALLALDAEVEIVGPGGSRSVLLSDFFKAYRKTALAPGEILAAVRIPRPFADTMRFYKVSKRVLDDISTVAAAFTLRLDETGKIREARLAYGGVAATPARALEAERALAGQAWDLATVKRTQGILAKTFRPISDHRGSAGYREAMVLRLFEKFYFDTRSSERAAS
jgi:xanthine dehydrogenase small subunit